RRSPSVPGSVDHDPGRNAPAVRPRSLQENPRARPMPTRIAAATRPPATCHRGFHFQGEAAYARRNTPTAMPAPLTVSREPFLPATRVERRQVSLEFLHRG